MDNVNVDFSQIEWQTWEKPGAIGRVKLVYRNGKRIRLMELPIGFDEENWCEIGHQGYVLEGNFTILFETGERFDCAPGMGFVIPDGEKHRSKGSNNSKTIVYVIDEIGVRQ
ncbi:MAG: hypothetical protein ACRC8J_00250 [Phocaeicola sp.]